MITIDGSQGEGGGQILRSSLALSLATGKPFCIENIRAKRKKPGLMRQHLTAVRAATAVGQADVQGDEIGSGRLTFVPGGCHAGDYQFAVGTAGSATLVLQAVLPALCLASGTSTLLLEGGTHNPWSPPFDFLKKTFLPVLNRMGPRVETELKRCGFYPAGGGSFKVRIEPAECLSSLELMERGEVVERYARALIARLPRHIGEREVKQVVNMMCWGKECMAVEEVNNSPGPGNILMVEIESRQITELFCGFGQKGVRAEDVANETIAEVRKYLSADVPVGRHLADQIMIPIALAGSGRFRTLPLSRHSTTNLEVISLFLDLNASVEKSEGKAVEVKMEARQK
jgi:RNA 3'-terminal phosphate cyclase (ATP)